MKSAATDAPTPSYEKNSGRWTSFSMFYSRFFFSDMSRAQALRYHKSIQTQPVTFTLVPTTSLAEEDPLTLLPEEKNKKSEPK